MEVYGFSLVLTKKGQKEYQSLELIFALPGFA